MTCGVSCKKRARRLVEECGRGDGKRAWFAGIHLLPMRRSDKRAIDDNWCPSCALQNALSGSYVKAVVFGVKL